MTFNDDADYAFYARRIEKEFLENILGIGYTTGGMYDSNHVLWPVALYLVRINFECNPGIFLAYSGTAHDLLRMSDLSDMMDWFTVQPPQEM